MKQYLLHFKTITIHKWYVMMECFKVGLYWQGLVHDLSKYSITEFATSARYFQGTSSPIDAEKRERGYSIAWQNHKAKNKHHWHYWTDVEKGELVAVKMPYKYVLEMACDFIGAGKAYNKDGTFTQESPLDYYQKTKKTMVLHEDTRDLFEAMLSEYASCGTLNDTFYLEIKKYRYEKNT